MGVCFSDATAVQASVNAHREWDDTEGYADVLKEEAQQELPSCE